MMRAFSASRSLLSASVRIPSSLRPVYRTPRPLFAQSLAVPRRFFAVRTPDGDERDEMEYDVVIVGGGPAGLAAAIRLKQLAKSEKRDISVCLIDKGSEIGSHILSGACIEPRALDELLPDWKNMDCPMNQPVTEDHMLFLTETRAFPLPAIPSMNNHGNYVASLGALCAWMGKVAEELEVEIFPGIAATEPLYEGGVVRGVITADVGIAKDGSKKSSYVPGMVLRANMATVVAEGVRGSMTKGLFDKYSLRRDCQDQVYAIGYKEVWEIPESAGVVKPGLVNHTAGWPLTNDVYGGSFMYHVDKTHIHLGLVVGLGYSNPHLFPYMEFQRMKHHPFFKKYLDVQGAECIRYGARTLSEGGLPSMPKLAFPGGMLIGDTAGTLNIPKIKGTHTAMKCGMAAAEAIMRGPEAMADFDNVFKNTWAWKELYAVRNYKQLFGKYGNMVGFAYCGISEYVLKGREPWTLKHCHTDHDSILPLDHPKAKKIDYPKPDGKLSFDRLTNLIRSGVNHDHDQPGHLKLKDTKIPSEINLKLYDGPETKYCPAGVYEYHEGKLMISAQNCVHCKACDIKDPRQNINWTCPQGGGGPEYAASM